MTEQQELVLEKFREDVIKAVESYYYNAISADTKRGIQRTIEQGNPVGRLPFGYNNASKHRGKTKSDQSKVVRTTFELCASGKSLSEISEYLDEQFNRKIRCHAILRILTNRFYMGEMRFRGEYYPHNLEPIVSRKLFDKVQISLEI